MPPNKDEARKITGDILNHLSVLQKAFVEFEEEDAELERLMDESTKLPPAPVMSQEALFTKLKDQKK